MKLKTGNEAGEAGARSWKLCSLKFSRLQVTETKFTATQAKKKFLDGN